MKPTFAFKQVDLDTRSLVLQWLEKDHVKEYFYGEGLKNTVSELDLFVNGKESLYTHWIAYDKKVAFAYLMVSKVDASFNRWSPSGRGITLDLLIGEKDYLGKGFSHLMIIDFLLSEYNDVDEIYIDPSPKNSRAIRVYEKVGFKKIGEFIPSWDPTLHIMMRLEMKSLKESRNRILPILRTKRLLLRPWNEDDLEPFAKMNADPRVMEHFPSLLSKEESDAFAHRVMQEFIRCGYGLWAVSVIGGEKFIGFIGLFDPTFFSKVEIGWRLSYEHWGKGYALEGAKEALRFAFEDLKLDEVISFTSTCNRRSIQLMQRLGLKHSPKDDFDHPALPKDHPLSRHLFYHLTRDSYL